jgi:putative Mg2+ transporter-C (MgtC) family protein
MLSNELMIILKIILSAGLMFILGRERQKKRKYVGPRTLILLGSATTLLSSVANALNNYFALGGLITGVGFLCGGVITKKDGTIGGLTTATMIWLSAIIGITVGLGMHLTAVFTTIMSYYVLQGKGIFGKSKD